MAKNQKISQNAVDYVKKNYKELIKIFVGENVAKKEGVSISIFMAGSPGAGKTEVSKAFIKEIFTSSSDKIIRIDPDEIRKVLPGYNGKNSDLFQAAASIGVEKIHDFVLKKNLRFILDGTFANYSKACDNITRSLRKNKPVLIAYVFQNPLVAWEFTKKREKMEGRRIPKEAFIDQLFASKDNINKIKEKFGDKIRIFLINKDFKTGEISAEVNIENIDKYIKIEYSKKDLRKLLI